MLSRGEMNAIVLERHNPQLTGLQVQRKPIPEPGRGELLIRIERAPINPSDLMFLAGRYVVSKPLPVIPGMVAAGKVVASGGGLLAGALRGRRVCCAGSEQGDGTWAQYMVTDASLCVPLLPGIRNEAGCNLLSNPATVLGFLDAVRRGGHRAAIHTAAAGDLGRMLSLVCRERGIPLINIVRRQEQTALLKGEGAEHVLDSSSDTFTEDLRELAGELGATVAFDAVAGSMPRRLLDAAPAASELYVYGRLSGEPISFDGLDLLVKHQHRLRGFSIYEWLLPKTIVSRIALMVRAQRLLKRFETRVRRVVSLEEAATRIGEFAQGTSEGKTLIDPALEA